MQVCEFYDIASLKYRNVNPIEDSLGGMVRTIYCGSFEQNTNDMKKSYTFSMESVVTGTVKKFS